MNDDQEPARPLTRRQLRAVVHRIAQTYLEVERGLRPPDHLRALLTDGEYRRHRILPPQRPVSQGPVRPPDIGPIHVASVVPGRIHASVLVRRDTDRWSALVLGLHHIEHTWTVDKLDRLERLRRGLQRQQATQTPENDIGRRIRHVEEELLLTKAAKRAVQERLDELGDQRSEPARAAAAEADRWASRSAELDAELAVLRHSQHLRHQHQLTVDADLGAAVEADLGAAVDETGPAKPDGTDVASIRTATAREVLGYRQRWNLPGDVSPLAAPVATAEQGADRQRVIEHLHGALQELQADDRLETHVTGREPDIALGLEP